MVELKSNEQAKKLGAIATFLDIPVTVSTHKSLNSSKGVIRSRDLRCCSAEEMVEELSGVTHALRIKVRRGEEKIQTDTVVLTFDSLKPPSRIRAGYLTLDVRQYVPLPMRCYECQRYGTAMTGETIQPAARPVRSSWKNKPFFATKLRRQARKAVVVEIHKTISTRTFASAVKSQLRTKPAALPKDGGRSVPSAPPKRKKAQKDSPAPSPQGAAEPEVPAKRRVEKSKRQEAPRETVNRFAPLAMDAEDAISSIWGDSSTPSSPRASASPMECPPSPSKPQSPSKSCLPPPAEKPQGPPPSPSPLYPFTPEVHECRLGEGQVPPRGYTLLLPQGGSPGGEAALLSRNETHFSDIDLKTGLHAAAATISLEKTLTVCSLYLLSIPKFRNFLWLNSLRSFRSPFSCWETSTRIPLRGGTPAGIGGGGCSRSSQLKMTLSF
ncbi:Gag-like protein [Plakobranchus ocellatus]|uniref:Gag-like protein n=1 Tax=Plakobranchus ocellatus TaxID=259542 RepID=A0AAV4D934_9GAST|nr:Gag-like protein [Plakobranchus ocellatus]